MKTNLNGLVNLLILGLLVVGLFFGCGKKSALEPGMTGLTFQGTKPGAFAAVASAFGVVSAANTISVRDRNGSEAGVLTLTEARVALKEIKFKKSGEDAGEAKYQGPYIVDLLSGVVTPELPAIRLGAGDYERIELKLAKLEDGQVADGDVMAHKSIYLAGTYTGNTSAGAVTDAPFTLTFELDDEFFLSGDEALVISDVEPNPIIVAFRLNRWVAFDDSEINDKNVDFSQVAVSGGEISLSDQSGATDQKIWEVIRKGIKESADFGKDDDDNGVLECAEDEDDDSKDSRDY